MCRKKLILFFFLLFNIPVFSDSIFEKIPQWHYKLVESYSHNPKNYTQGLQYKDGVLYESTGSYGKSTLQAYRLNNEKPIFIHRLPEEYFAEGMTLFNKKIYQITWHSNKVFIYSLKPFKLISTKYFPTQGWGLTTDNQYLIMSDGSSAINFYNPNTFKIEKTIYVHFGKTNIGNINELEYVNGIIYANVYTSSFVLAINANSGAVIAAIDFSALKAQQLQHDVLNGIAYDSTDHSFLITGKYWDRIYRVVMIPYR